jgi:hypothetical protein
MPASDRELRGRGSKADNIQHAAEVYRVRQDQRGNRMVSDAQLVTTKRVLASLDRMGLVTEQQHLELARDGRSERCCSWSTIRCNLPLERPRDSLSGGCIQANSTTMHQNAPVSRAESPGRLVLESKEDLRKRGMPSPDEGDTVALCFTEPGGVVFHRAVHHYQEPDLDWVV